MNYNINCNCVLYNLIAIVSIAYDLSFSTSDLWPSPGGHVHSSCSPHGRLPEAQLRWVVQVPRAQAAQVVVDEIPL